MKLLLDQNLSRKLIRQLELNFPESRHVSSAITGNADDAEIWRFAKANGFTIVTKDDDFEQRSIL